MKTLLLAIALATFANAGGLWDMMKNSNSQGTIQTTQYTISVSGVDTRAYVFPVKEMDSVCILTYSSQGIPAINCKTMKEINK